MTAIIVDPGWRTRILRSCNEHEKQEMYLRGCLLSKHRFVVLDAVRGVCALAVMAFHFTGHTDFPNAVVAVDLFFMLSGFVICASYGQRVERGEITFSQLIMKRLIRLYPMFLLGLALGSLTLIVMRANGYTTISNFEILGAAVFNSLFMPLINTISIHNFGNLQPAIGSIAPANGALWSLFFEAFISLCMMAFINRRPRELAMICVLALVFWFILGLALNISAHSRTLQIMGGYTSGNVMLGYPRVIFGFSVGVLIYKLTEGTTPAGLALLKMRASLGLFAKSPVMLIILTIAALCITYDLRGMVYLASLIVLCPLILLLGSGMTAPGRIVAGISNALGWLSYPLYCLHIPVGNLISVWLHGIRADAPLAFQLDFPLVASAASILLAVIAGLAIDEPVRKWLTRRFDNGGAVVRKTSGRTEPGKTTS